MYREKQKQQGGTEKRTLAECYVDMLKKNLLAIAAQSEDLVRVARFFLVHDTKTGNNVANDHKWHQMVIKYPKCP
jgi:hypothetical protein